VCEFCDKHNITKSTDLIYSFMAVAETLQIKIYIGNSAQLAVTV